MFSLEGDFEQERQFQPEPADGVSDTAQITKDREQKSPDRSSIKPSVRKQLTFSVWTVSEREASPVTALLPVSMSNNIHLLFMERSQQQS